MALSQGIELRLHCVEGLPQAGTVVVVEVHLGDGTKWTSAPAASHGTTAYVGAWVALRPTAPKLLLRVTDRSGSAIAQCSSGTIKAQATLPLSLPLAQPDGEREEASPVAAGTGGEGPVTPACSDGTQAVAGRQGAVEGEDEEGWRHVSLDLADGAAGRLAHAVESALGGAAEAGDAWEAATKRHIGHFGASIADTGVLTGGLRGGKKEESADADVEAAVEAALAARGSRRGRALLATTAAAELAVPPQLQAEGQPEQQKQSGQLERQQQVEQHVGDGREGRPVVIEMPEIAGPEEDDGGVQRHQSEQGADHPQASEHSVARLPLFPSTITLKLSYRLLRQPASSLAAATASSPGAAAASSRSLQASRTFIRLLSWQPRNGEGEGAGQLSGRRRPRQSEGFEAESGGEAVGRQGTDGRHHVWRQRLQQKRREQLSDAVQEGLVLELPLVPLPRRLHSYGHGAFMGAALSMLGDRDWQDVLRSEDPQAFASAKRVTASLKLLAKSRRKQGLTRFHLALMPCLENSPVLAAYGAVRSGCAKMAEGQAGAAGGGAEGTGGAGRTGRKLAAVQEGREAEEGGGELEQDGKEAAVLQQLQGAEGFAGPMHAADAAGGAVKDAASAREEPDAAGFAAAHAAAAAPVQQQMAARVEAPLQGPQQAQQAAAAAGYGDAPPSPAPASPTQPGVLLAPQQRDLLVALLKQRGHLEAAEQVQRYQQGLQHPNKYGYRPIAQEWDIWVHPQFPADVAGAGISHGSATQLVTQAVTTSVPCTRSCARSAGEALIRNQGTSPVAWLTAFGAAINAAAHGSRSTPLPLAAPPGRWWRLRLTLHSVRGLPTNSWEQPYLKAEVASSAVTLPSHRTPRGSAKGSSSFVWRGEAGSKWPSAALGRIRKKAKVATESSSGDGAAAPGAGAAGASRASDGAGAGVEMSFWPLPLEFVGGEELHLELRGDPAGIVADTQVGAAALPLRTLCDMCPQLLAGQAVHLEVPLERQSRGEMAAAAAARRQSSGVSSMADNAAAVEDTGRGVASSGSGSDEVAEAGTSSRQDGKGDGGTSGAQQAQHAPAQQDSLPPAASGLTASQQPGSPASAPAAGVWCGCFASPRKAGKGGGAASNGKLNVAVLPTVSHMHIGRAMRAEGAPPAAAAAAAAGATAGAPATLVLTVSLETVCCLDAFESVGVERAAAQTCLAMLSEPGGLYLDVKSAYSTTHDLEVFVSVLKGLGITTKAVCSFQQRQLKIPRAICPTVLFFHGLSGLENACDARRVAPGQFVLFNGASFLSDLSPGGLQLPEDRAAELLGSCRQYPLDALVVRRYKGLVEQYGFAGGIYVQEPDTSASAAQALIGLLCAHEGYFPLGFAYGHLRDAAVSVLELNGRGFASQEILEELASRGELATKVVTRINAGEHRGVSPNVAATWAGRLVASSKLLSLREQRALIALLGELQPGQDLLAVLDDLGGIQRIVLRFFQHYESTTPMTLLEAGWNFNYQKAFLRLMRNHGALAVLPLYRKIELARFFIGAQLRGYGLTYVLMFTRLRLGLHKHAKEGLLCLLESCTQEEYDKVLLALGGRAAIVRRLKGRWRLSWHYVWRMDDVQATHAKDPCMLAYQNGDLKYSALPEDGHEALEGDEEAGLPPSRNYLHVRYKKPREKARRQLRKLACCACTLADCLALNIATLGFFTVCCLCPRVFGATFKGTCAMPTVLAFLLGLALAVGLYILLAAVLPDV